MATFVTIVSGLFLAVAVFFIIAKIYFLLTVVRLRSFLHDWKTIDDCTKAGFNKFLTSAVIQGLHSAKVIESRQRMFTPADFGISFDADTADEKATVVENAEVQENVRLYLKEIDAMVAEQNVAKEVSFGTIDFFEFRYNPKGRRFKNKQPQFKMISQTVH